MLTDIAIDYEKITAKNLPKECMISSATAPARAAGRSWPWAW